MAGSKRPRRAARFERVYFIGAGLSAGMRYPVGQTLMPCLVDYLRGKTGHEGRSAFTNSVHDDADGPQHAEQILRVIDRVLRTYFATTIAGIQRVDVAEFFTLAQSLAERSWLVGASSGARRPHADPGSPSELTLFNDLAAITRSYFMDLSTAYEYPDDIDAILRLVRPGKDAIVNFNWDEEVDIFFSSGDDEDVSYTLGAWHTERETLVLKPHGSVGWYDCKNGIGNDDAYLIAMADDRIPRYEKRIVAYMDNDRPLELDGETYHSVLACPPVITAPTFAKRFDYVEQHRIWQDVLEVCRNATDFIFLGYSLPKDDFLTRAAIRAALFRNGSSRRLRCLVVTRAFDDSTFLNFASVFEGVSRERNHLAWEFGSGDSSLGSLVSRKLRTALVATP